MYYALIGDMVGSKKMTNRTGSQDFVKTLIHNLNIRFEKNLVSQLTITLGDEFQGLFDNVESVLTAIDTIDTYCKIHSDFGVSFRYGIGYGAINTAINPELSIGADGPAYWNAREAIEFVHENNDGMNTNSCFRNGAHYEHINNMMRIMDAIRNNWTQTQAAFMWRIFDTTGFGTVVPGDIAITQSMSAQQVSNRLRSTYTRQYIDARLSLVTLIKGECE